MTATECAGRPRRPAPPGQYRCDDDYCYYTAPGTGETYVEETPRSRVYIPARRHQNPAGAEASNLHFTESPTALYRLYDEGRRLLYIGITKTPESRWNSHAIFKSWWPEVSTKTVDWYSDRWMAAVAEYIAITDERPVHNRDRERPSARTVKCPIAARLLDELDPQ